MARSGEAFIETKPLDIAIVGGGLGGVVLAIGLFQQKNINVKIYEAAKAFGEIGAGVTSGPNALRALELVSPDLLAAYQKHETPNQSTGYENVFLEMRHGVSSTSSTGIERKVGDFACNFYGKEDPNTGRYPRSSIHRARFLEEIIKLVPPGIASFNKSLVSIEELDERGGGRVRMQFADGSSAEADAVIGCDGIKSVVRSHLHGSKVQPKFSGGVAYRALVPCKDLEEKFGYDLTYNGIIYVGQNGYIMTYPVERGKLINTIAIKFDPNSKWPHGPWLIPCELGQFYADFKGWKPELLDIMAKYGVKDQWALYDLPHDESYYRGKVCLMGDSIHATTPHLGCGASQAFEDAYVLSNLLGRINHRRDLENAFRAYDHVRRPRTQQVIEYSRRSGNTLSFILEGVGDEVEKLDDYMQQLVEPIWYLDLPQHLQEAIDIMS